MTELLCPECGKDEAFVVACPEYVHYEHNGTDWTGSRADDEPEAIRRDDLPYRVSCDECGHEWETPQFS